MSSGRRHTLVRPLSVVVMSMVWKGSRAKGSSLLLLLAIADFANEEGIAWPSQQSLADRTRMSRRHVIRMIDALVDSGELELVKEATPRRAAVYQVKGCQDVTPGVTQLRHLRGDTAMSPDPSITTKDGEAKIASPAKLDLIFEAVAEVLGVASADIPKGKTARGSWNAAVRDLKAESATPDEIRAVAAHYRSTWPSMSLTPTALAKHFVQLRAEKKKLTPPPPCSSCGIGAGMHAADCERRAAA